MTERAYSDQTKSMGVIRAAIALPGPQSPKREFQTIFADEFDYVWFTLRRFGVWERDLEDITHEVFITVYRHLDDYDPARPLRPWLFSFAYRMASDYRKLARHRAESLDARTDYLDPSPSAVEQLAMRESLDLAQRALDQLDVDRRAVFLLHDVDGYPMPEVCAALQIPLNTSYSRLRLAREQFSKTLNRLRAKRGE